MARSETYREKQAFEFYYGLTGKRTYKPVAVKFGVTEQTVSNWAKKHDWEGRVIDRDILNAQKVARENDLEIQDWYKDLLYLAVKGKNVLMYQVYKNKVELPANFLRDLKTLFELSEYIKVTGNTGTTDSIASQKTISTLGTDLGSMKKHLESVGGKDGKA